MRRHTAIISAVVSLQNSDSCLYSAPLLINNCPFPPSLKYIDVVTWFQVLRLHILRRSERISNERFKLLGSFLFSATIAAQRSPLRVFERSARELYCLSIKGLFVEPDHPPDTLVSLSLLRFFALPVQV